MLTGAILILGIGNLIAFTPVIVSNDFGFSLTNPVIGKIGVESLVVQPYSIWVFILYLFSDWKFLKEAFAKR